MFERVGNGIAVVGEALKVFAKRPLLIVPLLLCWIIYAPIVIYLKYYFSWKPYSLPEVLLIVFFIIFIFSFIFSLSCLILLELIQQLETGKEFSLASAFAEVISKDLVKTLPVTLVWAAIWFILTVILALLSRKDEDNDDDEDASPENVARTLAGYESFSLSKAFFRALNKAVRMIVFLILPAIAWEDKSPIKAVKKGLGVLKTHVGEFATGFALTELGAIVVFIPPSILFAISEKANITFPDYVWVATIIYCAFAWSFSMFLEQMFAAELYLWHLMWEEECTAAREKGERLPRLAQVRRPSVLDDVSDLMRVSQPEKNYTNIDR